jgi:hypothetical protein
MPLSFRSFIKPPSKRENHAFSFPYLVVYKASDMPALRHQFTPAGTGLAKAGLLAEIPGFTAAEAEAGVKQPL